MLWQHLFWFFGHPEVYIIALPFFGIVTEVFPVFCRKPVFGYKGFVFATISIGALSVGVWAHHMYATGAVLLPFFAHHDHADRRADRREVLQLDRHDVGGSPDFETADAVRARLPAHVRARRPHRRDPGGAAARLPPHRLVLRGRPLPLRALRHGVFALFAGFYYWWPKWTGKMLNERLGKIHFWLMFLGFNMHLLVQHLLGIDGMPRRYADVQPEDNYTWMNQFPPRFVSARYLDDPVPAQRVPHGASRAESHLE